MANLTLSHSGDMDITGAYISDDQVYASYGPNQTGAITGWTHNHPDPLVCGETYTITLFPQYSGTVFTENFTVSGYDNSGALRSDTSALRQGFNTDLRDYVYRIWSGNGQVLINSTSVTENYVEVNATVVGYNSNNSTSLKCYDS